MSFELIVVAVLAAALVLVSIMALVARRAARVERDKIFDELMDMNEPDLKRFQDALKAYDRIKKYERGERRLDGGLKQ